MNKENVQASHSCEFCGLIEALRLDILADPRIAYRSEARKLKSMLSSAFVEERYHMALNKEASFDELCSKLQDARSVFDIEGYDPRLVVLLADATPQDVAAVKLVFSPNARGVINALGKSPIIFHQAALALLRREITLELFVDTILSDVELVESLHETGKLGPVNHWAAMLEKVPTPAADVATRGLRANAEEIWFRSLLT